VGELSIDCPVCRVRPEPGGTRCPDCGEELAAVIRLRTRGALEYNRALEYAGVGEDELAVRHLLQALDEDAGLVDALVVLGKLHLRGGRVREAHDAWDRALGLMPEHPAARAAVESLASARIHVESAWRAVVVTPHGVTATRDRPAVTPPPDTPAAGSRRPS
jgi:hypothetical protein